MSDRRSTIPAVKTYLLDLFTTATDAEKTEVWPSRTEEDHQLAENVYLGRARGSRNYKTWPVLAPHSIEETYTVTVEVEVYRGGTDNAGAEARMWEIVASLEAALVTRPNLEELTTWNISTGFEHAIVPDALGVLAKYSFGLYVVARI